MIALSRDARPSRSGTRSTVTWTRAPTAGPSSWAQAPEPPSSIVRRSRSARAWWPFQFSRPARSSPGGIESGTWSAAGEWASVYVADDTELRTRVALKTVKAPCVARPTSPCRQTEAGSPCWLAADSPR